MQRFRNVSVSLAAVSLIVSILFAALSSRPLTATPRGGFGEGSIEGSFASIGRAGAAASVSVGVASFDGRGNVTRIVRVNAGTEDGDRVLIDITSTGTYTVAEDGTGVISFLNTFTDGSTEDVEFDFVITRTSQQGHLHAAELFAIDREPGVTASPVTESFTLRDGL